jgi:hypothetical protein
VYVRPRGEAAFASAVEWSSASATSLGGVASSRAVPSVLSVANLKVVGRRAIVRDRDMLLDTFASYASRLFSIGDYAEKSFACVYFEVMSTEYVEACLFALEDDKSGLKGIELDFAWFVASCRACGVVAGEFEEARARREAAFVPVEVGSACKPKAGAMTAEARAEKVRADAARTLSQRGHAFDRVFSSGVPSAGVSAAARKKQTGGKGASAQQFAPDALARSVFGVLPRVVSGGAQGSRVDIESVGGKRASSSVCGNGELRERGSRLKRRARSRGCGKDGRSHGRGDARQEGDSILLSNLGRQLIALGVEREVVEAILAYMLDRFGDRKAWQLVDDDDDDWLLVWDRWVAFASELQELRVTWDCEACLFLDHVKHLLQELLFALFRVVDAQAPVSDVTNEERLSDLEARGFTKRNGQVWGENDCLADSLLQLLISSNVVPEGVDRELACKQNRWNLERQPALVPRTRSGRKDLGGMLQHHRHATATLRFFLDWFSSDLRSFPVSGVRLSVHARYDGDVCSDVDVYCEGVGECAGGPLLFDVFNTTGADYAGFHYDPLVHVDGPRRDVAMVLSDGEDDERTAAIAAVGAAVAADAVTPDVVMHSGGGMDDDCSGKSAAGSRAPPLVSLPKERRVLRRHNSMKVFVPELEDLRTALRRLSLGTRHEASDFVESDTELASPRSVSDGAMLDSAAMAPSDGGADAGVVALGLLDGLVDLTTSGIDPCSSRPVHMDAVAGSSAAASSLAGVRPGAVVSELFDVASIAEGRCRARLYSKKNLPVVFAQCDKQAKFGDFCKRHKDGQAQGVWDPPLHANLPAGKLEEAKKDVAKWRAQTASTGVPSAKAKGCRPKLVCASSIPPEGV